MNRHDGESPNVHDNTAATTYPRWARHLDPALRRCSNCQGHGSVGSWHQPIKCGVCDEGFVPVDSPFASGTSTACPTCGEGRMKSAAHSYKYDEATDRFVPSSYRWPPPARTWRSKRAWLRAWLRSRLHV